MFQIALVFTLADPTADECLVDLLVAFSQLAKEAGDMHAELMGSTWSATDQYSQDRLTKVARDISPPEVRQRARDIWNLAKWESAEREGRSQ